MALTRCLDCGTRTEGPRCATCQQARDNANDYSTRRRIRSGWDWRDLRNQVIQRDGRCQHCGAGGPGVAYRVHHVIPLGQGGTNALANLRLLCADCHRKAHRGGPARRPQKAARRLAPPRDAPAPLVY